jgi:tetratricopeptide (TPR) repeat protein
MVTVAIAAGLLMSVSVHAQEVAPEPIQLCAQTDAYKAFEQEQYNQYIGSPAFQPQLKALRDIRAVFDMLDQTGKGLDERSNALSERSGGSYNDAALRDYIQKGLTDQKLPTCYENPLTYFLLSSYASEIDEARKRLGLPLPTPLNLATLPGDEINAHTFLVLDGTERVVAVNTQLFMFAYQMTKVTLPTLGLRSEGESVAISVGAPAIDQNVLVNFAMAIQEFLGLVPPTTQSLDQAYDPLLIEMVAAVEKFVIAHEYGHVIKNHKSPVGSFRLGAAADAVRTNLEIPYLLRSWRQEIEADKVGFQLFAESLRTNAEDASSFERRAYRLYGALFFFRCMEIIDRARALLETGQLPAPPTLSERQFVRSYLAGATTAEQDKDYAALLSQDHPPVWVRREHLAAMLQDELAKYPSEPLGDDYFQIATAIDRNSELIWASVADRLPLVFAAVQAMQGTNATPDEPVAPLSSQNDQSFPDCPMPTSAWAGQSICTPELMRAIDSLRTATDEETLKLYGAALQRDWLLLSGAQLDWAKRSIADRSNLDFALALVALAGVVEALPQLDLAAAGVTTEGHRASLARAQAFVKAHARQTSLDALASANAANFRRETLLAYPSRAATDLAEIVARVPARTPTLDQFFAEHGSMDSDGSMAGLMAASLYLRHTDGAALTTFADMLLDLNRYDAALSYARAGKERGALASMVELTIGNILSAQGKFDEAIEHYLVSLQAGRIDGWPEINMASSHSTLGDNKAAEQWFKAGLKRRATARSEREYAGYQNAFAWFLVTKYPEDKGRMTEALQLSLESNVLTGFADAGYLDTLAECFYHIGDMAHAIEMAEAAAQASTDPVERAEYSGKAERWKAAGR